MKKAQNLLLLHERGIRVPKGFTVPAEHFQTAISPLVEQIHTEIELGRAIDDLFSELQLPTCVEDIIFSGLAEVKNTEAFAVRSSGAVWNNGIMIGEDSDAVSLAGQFESYLNVPRSMVPTALKRCWASIFNSRTVSRFGGTEQFIKNSLMAVLVQEMVTAEACAVMMTVDPQGNGDTGALEFAWGACEGIVAGSLSPDEVIFSRPDGKVLSKRLGRKERIVTHSRFENCGCNSIKTVTMEKQRNCFSLSDVDIQRLISMGYAIEQIFHKPQDIEAVFSESGELIVIQARTITVLPPNYKSAEKGGNTANN